MIYSFLFAVFIAASAIFIEDATGRYPLWFSIFFNSLMTLLFFFALSISKVKDTYKACLNNMTISMPLMLFSMLIYILCFFSTDMIGGSPYNTYYFATSGFLGYLLMREAASKVNKGIAAALAVLIITCTVYRFFYAELARKELLGIFYAILASLSGFLYAIFSKKLAYKENLSPVQILSIRFFFLLILSFFLLPSNIKELISFQSMLYMLMLTVTGMILPVYFLQKGIHIIGPEKNAVVVAFVPFLTLSFSVVFHQFFDIRESVFVIILTFLLLIPAGITLFKRVSLRR